MCYILIPLNFIYSCIYLPSIGQVVTELWHVCSNVRLPRDAIGRTVNSRFMVKYQLVILGVHD